MAAIMTFFVSRTFGSELKIFVDRDTRHRTEMLAPLLARYYNFTESWNNIDKIFQTPVWLVSAVENSKAPFPTLSFLIEDRRLIIADSTSEIVFDSQAELEGSIMAPSVQASAVPILGLRSRELSGYVIIGSTQKLLPGSSSKLTFEIA